MPEQDPIDFLSGPIDLPEVPDPGFAATLLGELLDDLAHVTPKDAAPLRAVTPAATIAEQEAEAPSAHLVELVPEPAQQTNRSWVGGRLLGAAAVVLVMLGGLALLNRGPDDQGSPVTAVDGDVQPELTPASQIAEQFMTARREYDGATMRSLVADNATLANDYGITTPDDYLVRTEFERITETEITDVVCTSMTTDRVSCVFAIENNFGRLLRLDPYASEVIVTVTDGQIVDLVSAWENFLFDDDIGFFLSWLGDNHPDDLSAVMDTASNRLDITVESAAIIAARSPEFSATAPMPLLKLLHEDPRFSTLTDGLARTELGDQLAPCRISAADTLFAPTNDAFDRYFATPGAPDRETVLGDVATFEALLVSEAIRLSGSDALGETAVDFETRSGSTITVVGGSVPSVEGVPVLPDTVDIVACNGVLHGIDELFIPNT